MRLVAALFVDPEGPYPSMAGVDCWTEKRDAFKYAGVEPVVCHPMCGPWGDIADRSKQDPGAAHFALGVVRKNGGVLEHPARSRLWNHHNLPLPGAGSDEFGGYTLRVDQVSYGHVCRKPTWLYIVRSPMPVIKTGGEPTHVVYGEKRLDARGMRKPCCSKLERRLTPPAFAEFLVAIAKAAT